MALASLYAVFTISRFFLPINLRSSESLKSLRIESTASCVFSSSISISSTNSWVAPVRVAITGFAIDIASISTTGIPSGTPLSSCLERRQKISHSRYKTLRTFAPTSPKATTLFSIPNFFAYPMTSTPFELGSGLPTSQTSISKPSPTNCDTASSRMS